MKSAGNQTTESHKWPIPCVGALIEGSNGRIFLAKSPKWSNKWIIPGGKVEHGERLEDALVREVKEETGLEVRPVHILHVKDCIEPKNYYKKAHFLIIDYFCKATGGREKIDGKELTEFTWVKPEDAMKALDIDEYSADAIDVYIKIKGISADASKGARNGGIV